MSRDEYNRMLLERLHGESRWENQPVERWTVADLDVAEITRTIEEAIRRGRAEDPGTRDPAELSVGLMRDTAAGSVVLFGRADRLRRITIARCACQVPRHDVPSSITGNCWQCIRAFARRAVFA
jgi:ATP-dependent DNA helicase RecG